MISRAVSRYIRVSPRKTRYVLNVIRGKKVEHAFAILDNVQKGAAFYIRQVLKSALDNAVRNTKGSADASNLFISKVTADGGPMLKRYKAGSMGRAMPIKRRTAHIAVELDVVKQPPQQLSTAAKITKEHKKHIAVRHPQIHAKKSETKAKVAHVHKK
jgi:large subunit ribosomal protein L22